MTTISSIVSKLFGIAKEKVSYFALVCENRLFEAYWNATHCK